MLPVGYLFEDSAAAADESTRLDLQDGFYRLYRFSQEGRIYLVSDQLVLYNTTRLIKQT